MMTKPSLDRMQAALDGELSPDEQAQLERQLAESPEARARWTALSEVSQLLGAAPMAGPRPGFSKRFQARLAERRSRPKVLWGVLVLGVTAPVGLTVIALLLAGSLVTALMLAPSPADWMSAQVTGAAMNLADARAISSTLATSAYAVSGWALSQPLTWLFITLGGAVVAAWLYAIRKVNLEVSLS